MGSSIGHQRKGHPKYTSWLSHMESIHQHFASTLEITIKVSDRVAANSGHLLKSFKITNILNAKSERQ
jgi:hypothetical protein